VYGKGLNPPLRASQIFRESAGNAVHFPQAQAEFSRSSVAFNRR